MINNPYQTYHNTQAMTASPGELTLMLYNGAIRFLKQTKQAMEQENLTEMQNNIRRTQDIIHELMATLNPDMELSQNLFSLYEFMNRHLLNAQLKKDPALVQDVIELMEDLRNTWSEAVKATRGQTVAGAGY